MKGSSDDRVGNGLHALKTSMDSLGHQYSNTKSKDGTVG